MIDQLNDDWAHLSDSSQTCEQVRRWAAQTPELTGCTTLEDVRQRTWKSDPQRQDEILRSLLQSGLRGDDLARRTVFHTFIGAAVRRGFTPGRLAYQTHDDVGQDVASALWDAIATYPLDRRPTKIPANLVMETVRRLSVKRREALPPEAELRLDPVAPKGRDRIDGRLRDGMAELQMVVLICARREDRDTASAAQLLEVLAWGVDVGAITREQAALLIRVYCPPPGSPGGSAVAAEMGLSWTAVRQRCSRSARALAAAVSANIESGDLVIDSCPAA